MNHQIVLASSSSYRKSLLEQLQLSFTTVSPRVDESPLAGESVTALVQRLAVEKARAVASVKPNSIIIASDQAAAIEGEPLGKPGSFAGAVDQLERCSGRQVTFHTALCVLAPESEQQDVVCTEVKFRPLTRAQIEYYVNREKPYDCAGSFKCESLGITLFESIKSSDPTALVGLPLISLNLMLARIGVDTLALGLDSEARKEAHDLRE